MRSKATPFAPQGRKGQGTCEARLLLVGLRPTHKFFGGTEIISARSPKKSGQLKSPRIKKSLPAPLKKSRQVFISTPQPKTGCFSINLLTRKKKSTNSKLMHYKLETYHRSNQDTCLIDKPAVKEGEWIQSGDLLADSASSVAGELKLSALAGQN